jgi:hypothetical protein
MALVAIDNDLLLPANHIQVIELYIGRVAIFELYVVPRRYGTVSLLPCVPAEQFP